MKTQIEEVTQRQLKPMHATNSVAAHRHEYGFFTFYLWFLYLACCHHPLQEFKSLFQEPHKHLTIVRRNTQDPFRTRV